MPRKVLRKGFKCLVYLDDVLVLLRRNGFAQGKIALLHQIIDCFGLQVNAAKSDFVLRSRREHLGLVIDLNKRAFSLSPTKLGRLKGLGVKLAKYASSHRRLVSKKQLAEFVGLAISVSPAVEGGRFNLLPLYDCLNSVEGW